SCFPSDSAVFSSRPSGTPGSGSSFVSAPPDRALEPTRGCRPDRPEMVPARCYAVGVNRDTSGGRGMIKFLRNGLPGARPAELRWFPGDWLGQNEPVTDTCIFE